MCCAFRPSARIKMITAVAVEEVLHGSSSYPICNLRSISYRSTHHEFKRETLRQLTPSSLGKTGADYCYGYK